MELNSLLSDCDTHVKDELASMPDVKDVTDFNPADPSTIPITARTWLRVEDVVAVVADMKNSTQLSVGKHPSSTASIYEAGLRPIVDIFHTFGAGWIPIHGDCVIGIFWDDNAIERAICAGITVKTFSERHFVKRLNAKWPEGDTGFKVGVATSRVLVKRIGRPNSPHQDIVWPGKALNHAVKAAQSGNTGELIVTGSVWDLIEKNDYLTFTCDCATPSPALWDDHAIDKLDQDDIDRTGRRLTSSWCTTCGEHFCNQILAEETRRPEVDAYRHDLRATLFKEARAKQNQDARERRRGLRRVGAR